MSEKMIAAMSEEMLKRYKIRAKKALGQNFLVNEHIIDDIANSIETEDKNIIEVGPGYGALTQKLLEQNLESLTLVELDERMVEILEDRIALGELEAANTNFKIENKDVLQYIPEVEKYSVIANIPYYITSPILRHFLYKLENKPYEMVILMQKDVGDKILDIFREGKKQKSSVIGLMMAKKSYVSELMLVGKENFVPAPNVESSVLLFESHNKFDEVNDEIFLRYIKIGFSSARKKLVKNLVAGGLDKEKTLEIFEKLKIPEGVRGEGLTIEKWCDLVGELDNKDKK
ncbi:16S rRNA (adenine(1518)-N(6)/adenine(1519)-N(6))-dimethyltransferase RsmA [Candidatus Gracilibacteria bacterium]|nr:16S rRNA (adenine(1518)-N(6)/adenine(1519)-N(6))-dimethyltransferase RsmA [Candidatus Gracilibacteria bacterium]